jgi:hypothetical protein
MYSEFNTKRASETTSLLIGGVNPLQTAAIAQVGEMPAGTLSQAFMARSTEAYIETLKLQWRQTLIRKYPDAALLGFLIDLGALTYFIVLFCRSGWDNMPYSSLYAHFVFFWLLPPSLPMKNPATCGWEDQSATCSRTDGAIPAFS